MIFNIQRFSTHDGQGIRTMIFFKGCPLRCTWCCNPESQSFQPVLLYDAKRCKNFRDCLKPGDAKINPAPYGITINHTSIYPDNGKSESNELKQTPASIENNISKPEKKNQLSVRDIFKYNNICASRALTVAGEEKSTGEIIEIIKRDAPFYGKDGGVTLSGGEPFSGGDSFTELLTALKENNFNVAVETSLHVAWEKISGCINLIDTFLVDLKHTDRHKFKEFTGGNAGLVIDNLRKLGTYEINLIIRIPVIPGFNHSMAEMKKILDFVLSLGYVKEIHFLPFHNLGSEKYRMMGMDNPFDGHKSVNVSELDGYVKYATKKGFTVMIGG
ncbi:MAG: glycyl-radical enzyme activating protein [Bacteroidales bacterium]